jgi:hypothetical protein
MIPIDRNVKLDPIAAKQPLGTLIPPWYIRPIGPFSLREPGSLIRDG